MTKKLLRVGVVALSGALAVALAACSGGGGGAPSASAAANPVKGGTVTWLDVSGAFAGTDPVGVYLGEEIAGFRRLVYRGLTAMSTSTGKTPQVLPDLATDTGTTPDGGKTWSFTLKSGLKWQDGTAITCSDLQYGLSRSYDSNLVTTGGGVGLTYLQQYNLYDPSAPSFDLNTAYTGPFGTDAAAQTHFNNAASCSGNTITYHFQNAWVDFPIASASLFSTDPYQKSFDKGAANNWTINSNGPYMMQGTTFDGQTGATFVRNPNYDATTDTTTLRGAYPDTVKVEFVDSAETISTRLIANSGADQTAFTPVNIPSSKYAQITPNLSSRVQTLASPYTRFLQVNSRTLTDPNVRNALVKATDQAGAIKALGGDKYGTPTSTIISSTLPGAPTSSGSSTYDVAGAKALLAKTSNPTPTIRFAFSDTSTTIEQVAAVLQTGWQAAGFQVTLVPIAKGAKPSYYAQMLKADKPVDVFYSGWAADWPSLSTVVPPILQSNPAGATGGVGFNYGFYNNASVDALIKQSYTATDVNQQQTLLSQADQAAFADGAYVPLVNQNNYFIYGSKLGGFQPDVASSYYPDLGTMYAMP